MKLFALTVGRNEEHRYLPHMMMHLDKVVDAHFFYDDRSTDKTVRIAERHATVAVRPAISPSFVENEGAFREAAWLEFEHTMGPTAGDWVLVIDCDEFLIDREAAIRNEIWHTEHESGTVAIDLPIKEVFGWSPRDEPLVRTDRLWGTIHAPRLFQYRPGGTFFHGEFGVPAVPHYVMGGRWAMTTELFLAHYGYAREEDQRAKYERYSGHPGHSNAHVQSILAEDKILEPANWSMP